MILNVVYLPHYFGDLLRYETDGSSGFDLRASEGGRLRSLQRTIVKTGLKIGIPSGFEMQIRPRSGCAIKNGLTIINSPGTIDSDFTGEIGILLINLSDGDQIWEAGDRLAQGVICPVVHVVRFWPVEELDETERGNGAYNSTGRK
jgi:dUTP pyrophosphatase